MQREFAVPFQFRLHFCDDVFGKDSSLLAKVLEASKSQNAVNNTDPTIESSSTKQQSNSSETKVQFWVDEHVLQSNPDLKQRIFRWSNSPEASHIKLTGSIQTVPGGEDVKNDIHIIERMLKVFHAHQLDRRSYVVVIGGGAVLDAVGFSAAIAHRGIRLVRIPTTTLAQADSGIGVKNGVNLFGQKNWIGSFAVPWAVLNDLQFLSTLSDRDFRCGFSEAVKVSLLKDETMFRQIAANADGVVKRDANRFRSMLEQSAHQHLDHITLGGDPFEALQARPLDFGHWSAHKMETTSEFRIRHGEAVAIGVAIDSVYSSLVYGFPRQDAEAVLECLTSMGFSLSDELLDDPQPLFQGLEEFRQHLGGELTVTMLEEIGKPIDVHSIDRKQMTEAIRLVNQWQSNRKTVSV